VVDDVTKHGGGGGRAGGGKEITTKDESGLEVFWVGLGIIKILPSSSIGDYTW